MACIVCGGEKRERVRTIRDYHYGIPGEFQISHCSECGLLQLDPMPTPQALFALYASTYYSFQPPKKMDWKRKLLYPIFRGTIPTHDPSFNAPGEFLDVGCGSGSYVEKMQRSGWHARGVEPGEEGVKNGRAGGLDIFHGTLREAHFPDNTFDYIRSNHSFEHMLDPVETLEEIFRVLRPGGKGFIAVPNVGSILYRIFGGYWWFTGPLHTYGYSPATLGILLRRAGFRVERVYYNSNYASIFGSLQIVANRKRRGAAASEGFLLSNRLLQLIGNGIARFMDMVHQGDAIEIIFEKPAAP